ncbi:MAG: sulfatase [Planctomycetota bacterium]
MSVRFRRGPLAVAQSADRFSDRLFFFFCYVAMISAISTYTATNCAADDRPNILWISCEDISANLGCYGDPNAITPTLDKLATEGVRFTRAFTPAGVCAITRSSIITGMHAPSIGSHHMRSNIIPPPDVKAFAELLRADGYFTTNRSKTDYQFNAAPSIWDRQGNKHQDWAERSDPEQPFFSVVNYTQSHESKIRQDDSAHARVRDRIGDSVHDPSKMTGLPPYFPDDDATRVDWAHYHDNITYIDALIGDLLDRLEKDGLVENTVVIFWSDHGMGLPRGKRWLFDTGIHIPVIVRWPGVVEPGSVREDLVTAIDFAPTTLEIAGIDVPPYHQGRVFLSADSKRIQTEPAYLFFHRDRMDEVYDIQRAARDRRWKYIRNYDMEKTYAVHLDYMDKMPTMRRWREGNANGTLDAKKSIWFKPTKAPEELYDTENDPWELNNLAGDPQFADRLARMRQAVLDWQVEINDKGMIPEAVMMAEMKPEGTPRTDSVKLTSIDGGVLLTSGTEGSSVVYRKHGEDHWQLYTDALDNDQLPVEAMACRLGYQDSPKTTVKAK